ncbi:MAG: MMPL family transporter [Gammaproteobacteria bacterium]|nr:MMPL family transporter [Gammaproteobacteria bacterium]NNJ83609.1 MMPL family transporter [Gammaproteobacteria bacterium]
MERRLSEWIIRRRWWFIVLLPVMVITLATGMMNLKFAGDYRVFFSKDNPQLQAFDRLEKTYSQDDNVIFLLAPQDGRVFSRETLTAVEDLTKRAWQIPYSLRVDSLTNFQHTEARGDELIVRDLVRNVAHSSDADITRIRDIALAEPLLMGKLISETAEITIVTVTVQLPRIDEMQEVPEVVDAADLIAKEMRASYPHLDIRLTGMVVMTHAFSSVAMDDMGSLTLVSFGVMLVVLLLLLRSAWGAIATLFVILMSILTGLGAGGYLAIPFTPSSASAPLIILTMALANSVHILVIFYQGLVPSAGRAGRRTAMQESLRINLQPIFLTSLTTAIGFLSLNFSEVPPFRDMGNFVAIGIVAAFILSITFLPALMILLPAHGRRLHAENEMMHHFADLVIRNRHWLFRFMVGMVVVLAAFIPRNELNDVFVRYLDESVEFRRDTDLLNEHLGGLYRIDYPLDSGQSNGIHDPGFLREVDAFAGWLRQQPEVTHVNTLTDTLKRLNENLHGDNPEWHRLPDKRDMAAQYLLLYEMSLPYGLDLNNQIDVDKSATRISAIIRVLSTNDILALDRRAQAWLQKNASGLQTEGTGPTMMFAHIGARNIRAMIGGTTLALVLISLILILALRSPKIGLISMVPNLVPAIMAFGVWGIWVGEVGLALSVVTSMTLGIVVDDTVHFLSKYLRARRERGDSPEAAVRYAFSRVGLPLIITTLVLIAGFLIMTFSSFYPNSGMGMLTAIVLGMALIADFLLLPPLLMRLGRN